MGHHLDSKLGIACLLVYDPLGQHPIPPQMRQRQALATARTNRYRVGWGAPTRPALVRIQETKPPGWYMVVGLNYGSQEFQRDPYYNLNHGIRSCIVAVEGQLPSAALHDQATLAHERRSLAAETQPITAETPLAASWHMENSTNKYSRIENPIQPPTQNPCIILFDGAGPLSMASMTCYTTVVMLSP